MTYKAVLALASPLRAKWQLDLQQRRVLSCSRSTFRYSDTWDTTFNDDTCPFNSGGLQVPC